MPRKATTTVETIDDPSSAYIVEIELDLVGENDVVKAVTFRPRVDGLPISTEGVREVPLGRLINMATRRLWIDRSSSTPATLKLGWRTLERDSLLELVATDYRAAVAWREPPTKAIAEGYRVSRATAGRWVAEARERGLLDTPAPFRAKES